MLTRTVHGRNTYAVGGNREAAVNAGIRVGPHMLINFILVGFSRGAQRASRVLRRWAPRPQ